MICPTCLKRLWFWQSKVGKQHERCHWKEYFQKPKAVRK